VADGGRGDRANGTLCTGSLVHPRVVMYAAHCGGGDKKILFGQSASTPFKMLSTELCMTYPDYSGVNDQEHDWAFCRLASSRSPRSRSRRSCTAARRAMVQEGVTIAVTGYGHHLGGRRRPGKNWGLTPIHTVTA
jgi:secreted trypsin-like serine protease